MELFETMLQHTSVRSFTQQKLTDELREQLILSAQSASSSNFLQAFSIIEITDAKKRKKICYVGGIRNNLFQMKDILELPELTYPVFGMFVGYPVKKNEVKPRLPLNTILGTNTYQSLTAEMINAYDEKTAAYYQARSTNVQSTNWSEKVRQHFEYPRRQNTVEFLKKQGFVF